MLLWLDTETSGLNPLEDRILEVGWTMTHDDLSSFGELKNRVIKPVGKAEQPSLWDDIVVKMHTDSGLMAELGKPNSVTMLARAEAEIVDDINHALYLHPDEPIILAGSGVHFDQAFINNWMPRVAKLIHYRIFDVFTITRFFTAAGVEPVDYLNVHPHRASYDVRAALGVARAYMESVRND